MSEKIMAPTAVVSVSGLSLHYGRTTALEKVTLRVDQGSVYALLGRNGAGKTSLVRCLLGHVPGSEGQSTIFGLPTWQRRGQIMDRVGVVPEESDAPPESTARQLVKFCSSLYSSWDGKGVAARLDRFQVPQDIPFGRLSKGQKGQLMLALALAPQPDLLILDDPTLGLDAVARRNLYEEMIVELADRGTTVLLATHDLAGVESIADRVGILSRGRLLLDEPLEQLKTRFRRIMVGPAATNDEAVNSMLEGFQVAALNEHGLGLEAVVSNYTDQALTAICRRPGMENTEASAMSLEEIFITLAGEEKKEATP